MNTAGTVAWIVNPKRILRPILAEGAQRCVAISLKVGIMIEKN